MKDLFSANSSDYKKFRPTYPRDLLVWISDKLKDRSAVWDCATGNGQAAIALTEFFEQIWATDLSESQLSQAEKHWKIVYLNGTAENSNLKDQSVNAVTVAQAFHWFDQKAFYKEVKRVCRPQGLLVVWSYSLALISPEVDAITKKLYTNILGGYWDKERIKVDQGYKKEIFPFEEVFVPKFEMKADWSLEQWLGYLQTWSAFQKMQKETGANPVEQLTAEFQTAWGKESKMVIWPLAVRAFRVS